MSSHPGSHTSHCHDCHSEESPAPALGAAREGENESVFHISGADCSDEVNAITKSLAELGITSVAVNLIASTATVQYPKSIREDQVRAQIEKTGVRVVENEAPGFFVSHRKGIALLSLSAVLLVAGLALDWSENLSPMMAFAVFGLSTALSGALVFPKALRAVKQRSLDMNFLMTIAAAGAFAIQEYSEGATVVFLFSLAELLEAFSVARARQAIRAVLKLTPQIAQVKRDGAIVALPVAQVGLGDLIIVRPGDSFPLDGTVTEGTSSVNQAPLTGESVPVEKGPGDSVFAGTLNEQGGLTVQVTKAFQDTKISRVMRLIEEAQDQKSPSERFVDRFARIYTPIVFLVAVLVATVPPFILGGEFDVWFYRALVLLVIACPCALVLATPISVVSALASLARRGVLVKGGKYLEVLGRLQAVALDKTGTLTEGRFQVQSFRLYGAKDETEALHFAYALESLSSHPLAKAVMAYQGGPRGPLKEITDYRVIAGRGAQGHIDGRPYFVGNHRMTHELGLCNPQIEAHLISLEQQSMSVVILGRLNEGGRPGEVLAIFGLGDTVKKNAKEAIAELHRVGIQHVVVLSGDNQRTVDAICAQTGIDQGKGDLLPEAKVEAVKNLTARYTYVGMVGDGVNDAPALANASVGISMGAAGTDAAIETSDISLMQDDLAQLPRAIQQGRRALNVIRFNIAFAIATKAAFLVLAIVGLSNLWLAVAADLGASVLVTLNALRLLRTKDR
ncbi:MAG: cadmium-translocating P-type ATPase [Bdellovibrionaceae bacterium]|nr:cadmium-translocating P-type ATPase [Pseudobdellovibrionaceae bacterium]